MKKSAREKKETPSQTVLFNFNGHSFEAYGVFGLPLGSPLSEVERAYEAAKKQVDAESQEFLDSAMQAIRHRQKVP